MSKRALRKINKGNDRGSCYSWGCGDPDSLPSSSIEEKIQELKKLGSEVSETEKLIINTIFTIFVGILLRKTFGLTFGQLITIFCVMILMANWIISENKD